MNPYETIKRAILGIPTDPNKQPSREGVVTAFAEMQAQLEGAQSGAIVKANYAALTAMISAPYVGVMAWVMSGPEAGIYENVGSTSTPSWERHGDIPQFLITGINAGSGTGNAIQIVTDLPVPVEDGRALIVVPIVIENTAVAPTIVINGRPPLTIVNNNGDAIGVGLLKTGMYISGFIVADKFRLINNQLDENIVVQIEILFAQIEEYYQSISDISNALLAVKLDTVSTGGTDTYALLNTVPAVNGHLYVDVYVGNSHQKKDALAYTIIDAGTKIKFSDIPLSGLELYVEGAAAFSSVGGGGGGGDIYSASQIVNDATLTGGGPNVKTALESLQGQIDAIDTGGGGGPISSTAVSNASAVTGGTVTGALNTLKAGVDAVTGLFTFATWTAARNLTMKDRSKFQCHISDFCAPSASTPRTSELENWMAQGQTAGVKNVMGSDGNGIADYLTERELEITRAGHVVEWDVTGGFGYGDPIFFQTWDSAKKLVRLKAVGTAFATSGKRVRTRRNYRALSTDAQDAPLSCVINIQAEGVQLIRPCVWLNCDYSNNSPSNLGDAVDVGIFSNRAGVQLHDPTVIGYYRRAGIYLDVTNRFGLPPFYNKAGSRYPTGTMDSGTDGIHIYNPYIWGGRVGLAILGALPKAGETEYVGNYNDAPNSNVVLADGRGATGCSDLMVLGGKIYGPDHHSNVRRADPIAGTLSNVSLDAEPDNSPAALHIDGLAGNGASNAIWGMTFVATRFATIEKFRVRLGRSARVRFIGCHTEGRSGSNIKKADGTTAVDTNNYVNNTYGNFSGTVFSQRCTMIGTVSSAVADTIPHYYGLAPLLMTDTGRVFSNEGIGNQPTSGGSAVMISTDGQLRKSSSAKKYKTNLRPITAVQLDLFSQLVGYIYNSTIEDEDAEKDYFGFIADYADELGLQELVIYNQKGEPEDFRYDRAVVMLHELQRRNNDALKEQLASFEVRLSELEQKSNEKVSAK